MNDELKLYDKCLREFVDDAFFQSFGFLQGCHGAVGVFVGVAFFVHIDFQSFELFIVVFQFF